MDENVKGDGRSTRWSAHRNARREELVLAAVAAIDQHGAAAGIDEIAEAAAVSKPVLYRYFADKDEIHAAVSRWGAAEVMTRLGPALLSSGPMHERVTQGVDAYLSVIAEHPNVFSLVLHHQGASAGADEALDDGKAEIASALARVLGDGLRSLGLDAGGAEPWAHGLVGLGLSVGEWWLERRTMSQAHVGAYLTDFVWHAFSGIVRQQGVDIDTRGLRLVPPSGVDAQPEGTGAREGSP